MCFSELKVNYTGVSKTPTQGRGRARGRGRDVVFFFLAIYLEIGFFWSKSIVTMFVEYH